MEIWFGDYADDSNQKATLKSLSLTTAIIILVIIAIAVAICVGAWRALPQRNITAVDERGAVHELVGKELTYAGQPVRMLTDAEIPMDNDGSMLRPEKAVTASAGTTSTE